MRPAKQIIQGPGHSTPALSENEEIRRIGERFQIIDRQIKELKREADRLVDRTIRILGFGRYEHLVIYKVGKTWVNPPKEGHFRRAHRVVRARVSRSARRER